MLVSTKGRYALRVMVDLAEHQAAGRIPLKEIAARQGISEKYLENILATLVRATCFRACAAREVATCSRARPSSTRWARSCA